MRVMVSAVEHKQSRTTVSTLCAVHKIRLKTMAADMPGFLGILKLALRSLSVRWRIHDTAPKANGGGGSNHSVRAVLCVMSYRPRNATCAGR